MATGSSTSGWLGPDSGPSGGAAVAAPSQAAIDDVIQRVTVLALTHAQSQGIVVNESSVRTTNPSDEANPRIVITLEVNEHADRAMAYWASLEDAIEDWSRSLT